MSDGKCVSGGQRLLKSLTALRQAPRNSIQLVSLYAIGPANTSVQLQEFLYNKIGRAGR